MQTRIQQALIGLALGCLAGAIAACQGTPETSESVNSVPETAPEQQVTTPAPETEPQSPETVESAPGSQPETADPIRTEPNTTAVESPSGRPSPLPSECTNPQTQTDMNLCAKAEYERADARLNEVYQAVKSSVSGQKESQLIAAETAWISFRDTYCDFVQAPNAGGSIQPLVYHGCLTLLTKSRVAELQQNKTATMGYEAADQALNTVYQDLQSYLTTAEQGLLTDAQLAWIEYRDAHCAFETGDTEACLAQVTETQMRHLEQQLDVRSL